MRSFLPPALHLAAAGTALLLTGCADKPPANDPDAVAEYQANNDPLEPTNRAFFKFNDTLDRYVLKPVAQGYVFITPPPVRRGLHNLTANLGAPVVFANDVAELHPSHAAVTAARMVINTTAGIGGLWDVAKAAGLPGHDANGDITFALWGVPTGPYLYLPFVGPTSLRGVAGQGLDVAFNPLTWVPHGYGLKTLNTVSGGVGVVDLRADLLTDVDKAKAGALDPYATFRTLYQQYEAKTIEDARHAD